MYDVISLAKHIIYFEDEQGDVIFFITYIYISFF